MPRVVVDPNVFVSALINPSGMPAQLVQAWRDGLYELLVCPRLIAELTDVIRRPKIARRINSAAADEFLAVLPVAALTRPDPPSRPGSTRDPDDDYLVSLAIEHEADLIVSGDSGVLADSTDDLPRLNPRDAFSWLVPS